MAGKVNHTLAIDEGSVYATDGGGFSVEVTLQSPKGNTRVVRLTFDQWDVCCLARLAHKSLDQAESSIRRTRDALCGDEA